MAEFSEIADRVWVARQDWFDVNVCAIGGDAGLVVVDTHASAAAARACLSELRRISAQPILAAVNTHLHFDHTFGNAVFAAEGAELIAHEEAARRLPAHAAEIKQAVASGGSEDPRDRELLETEVAVPERTFSSALSLDLGDRQVELLHPGRGHTDGDIAVWIQDAATLIAGDLIEESAARQAVPGFGADCYPLEWPATLDLLMPLISADTVVVPGHGAPVGLDFVTEQRAALGVVAETIRDLATRGIRADQALEAAQWPYPAEELGEAVRRGFEQLPRAQRRLPLL